MEEDGIEEEDAESVLAGLRGDQLPMAGPAAGRTPIVPRFGTDLQALLMLFAAEKPVLQVVRGKSTHSFLPLWRCFVLRIRGFSGQSRWN